MWLARRWIAWVEEMDRRSRRDGEVCSADMDVTDVAEVDFRGSRGLTSRLAR